MKAVWNLFLINVNISEDFFKFYSINADICIIDYKFYVCKVKKGGRNG